MFTNSSSAPRSPGQLDSYSYLIYYPNAESLGLQTWCSHKASKMFDPILVVVCCAGLGLTLSYFTLGSSRLPQQFQEKAGEEVKNDENSRPAKRRVMFVTAHPDDEVMFFGPTILHFTQREGALVYLLCLSTGDHCSQGRVRSKELWESCHLLGVSRENILLYRCDDLPDNPSIMWPTVRTANLINQYLHALDIDMVVTFDSGGVSGHINHSSLYSALQHLVEEDYLPENCEAFSLDTVNILRKYSSLLDVPLSYALSSCAFTVDRKQYSIIQRAMRAHISQYVWFRKLYMFFSRYVLINTLSRVSP
ncbi:N-acetylglucosaminyl-phosphatidylinositol de-N-acetylase-like [Penaeus japonicus]|uniref:N-acetylglucosaminyl-phosphatidylinositol de-N-acetylase-like n=1 Tax=Penaeus japonicus TaxID=27405 RepID=UPI001C70DE86|nr:N-acetylglucosaminyl-phosphatidylinositol de-N-acetylase-like [Penaeus japonicus]